MIKLSILIPSLESRKELLSELVCGLIQQCGIIKGIRSFQSIGCTILILKFENVEIITATDAKGITTGEKRNLLLSVAENDFVIQVDDDDYVYPYFVEKSLGAIQTYPDCVGTVGIITVDGQGEMEWRLSKDYQNVTITDNGVPVYLRTTNHISIVKRELALEAGFPAISNGEDKEFSIRLNPLLKTEVKINEPLYHYRFSSTNKQYS